MVVIQFLRRVLDFKKGEVIRGEIICSKKRSVSFRCNCSLREIVHYLNYLFYRMDIRCLNHFACRKLARVTVE